MERLPMWDNNLSTEISKGFRFNVNAMCKERGQAGALTATTTIAATTGRETH